MDSGVSQTWVKVTLLGLPIVFPNFDARRRVLFVHDVHHMLTGYATSWAGEGEISAFEIATGCKRCWAAWFFDGGGWLIGLVVAPRRMSAAFVRARRCTNFYGHDHERIASLSLDEARRELGLDWPTLPPTARDRLQFLSWSLAIVAVYACPVLALGYLGWCCC